MFFAMVVLQVRSQVSEIPSLRQSINSSTERRYSDPRNAGLLDGALVQDGLLNVSPWPIFCLLLANVSSRMYLLDWPARRLLARWLPHSAARIQCKFYRACKGSYLLGSSRCCTSQRTTDKGVLNLGCTPLSLGAAI